MKTFLIAIVLLLLVNANQSLAQRQFIRMKNVQPEYKSLTEVKPVLVNDGKQSIFLWPQECGEALVSYLAGEYWWDSDVKPCSKSIKPIEIKPGRSYDVPALVLRFELEPGQFREERIGKPAKFKITLSYSFKPFYRKGPPQFKESISKEFAIVL
jgi:hypothetical protein